MSNTKQRPALVLGDRTSLLSRGEDSPLQHVISPAGTVKGNGRMIGVWDITKGNKRLPGDSV